MGRKRIKAPLTMTRYLSGRYHCITVTWQRLSLRRFATAHSEAAHIQRMLGCWTYGNMLRPVQLECQTNTVP